MKLTKDTVAALVRPAGKADHIEWDDELPGFGVRMRGDSKRWDCQYRINGKQRRESLGDVRKVTLEDARKIARQRFAQVELGTDPGGGTGKARAQALTLAVVAEPLSRGQAGPIAAEHVQGRSALFRAHWKPLHDRPSTPSGAPTWRRGCRSSSRSTAGRRRRVRGQSVGAVHLGDERGAMRSQPGDGDQRSDRGNAAATGCSTDSEIRADLECLPG